MEETEQKKKFSRDLDDLSLFLTLFADKKLSCSQYIRDKGQDSGLPVYWNTLKVLQELATGNLTPMAAINSVILSQETPRNDTFQKLYSKKDTPTDMVFILKQEKFKCH